MENEEEITQDFTPYMVIWASEGEVEETGDEEFPASVSYRISVVPIPADSMETITMYYEDKDMAYKDKKEVDSSISPVMKPVFPEGKPEAQ